MDAADKLTGARCRLMAVEPFYGHVAMQMHWRESSMAHLPPMQRTMGVRVAGSYIECVWNREFVESQSLLELYCVVQHEIEHLIRLHCQRYGNRTQLIWNVACDMAVNGQQGSPRIAYRDGVDPVVPKGCVWIPQDWPSNETAEYYYDRLLKDAKQVKVMVGAGEGDNQGEKMVDSHGMWSETEMSPDEIRQVVKSCIEQAVDRARGHVPGHISELLKQLADPIVNWRALLRQYLGRHLGNRRTTYSRRNRRNDLFGIPGFSHRAASAVSVIVDTSGSIGTEELEQFFSEIEAMSYRSKVSVLQWDAEFQGFEPRYRRGDWKKIKIGGRGGTSMDEAVNWIERNHLVGNVCVMLTDGYTPWTPQKPFPMITCITTDAGGPDWGHVIRMGHKKVSDN